MRTFLVIGLLVGYLCQPASAQDAPSSRTVLAGGGTLEGPPPPVAPHTLARDEEGRATIRAVRLSSPLAIDGALDEAVYRTAASMGDFIQMEPDGGQPATEKTELWISFDRDNVYVSARAWESEPQRVVANEMRRDSRNIRQGDCIGFSFDTFYDRRNAFQFEVNPLGGRTDGQSTDERQYNGDWNPVWHLAVAAFPGGWTFEAAIPFKSLRYRSGAGQVWGFNARRINKWKNEISYLIRIPPAFGMGRGDFAASRFATVTGLELPSGAKNIEVKPYAIGELTADRTVPTQGSDDLSGDLGLDVRYGVTQNLTANFTYNTDFAQVEADEEQVNLTRFSLFFPEKREFFLENQGTFAFGGVSSRGTGTGGGGQIPVLFYSRRIGLDQGAEVPIVAGGRLTGRLGGVELGLLNIHTGKIQEDQSSAASTDSTSFGVFRVKRDVLRRSSVGAMVTRRSTSQTGEGSNQAFGIDGTFAFLENLAINTYWARTTAQNQGDDVSYRAQFEYAGDRYGVQLERLGVGANFDPQVGFVRRNDMRQSYAQLRFSPRPESIAAVRKLSWTGTMTYVENGAGRLDTREIDGQFGADFQNSDQLTLGLLASYEFLDDPFNIDPAVTVAAGGYSFTTARAGFSFGQQRRFSGNLLAERGTFYGGHRTTIGFSRSRANVTSQFSVEPSTSLNWVDLPGGSFTTTLVGARITYTVTPLMFTSALFQYSSSRKLVSANVRLRWEYSPGSELFVVYNEDRDSLSPRFPALQNRAVIVKINRLLRF